MEEQQKHIDDLFREELGNYAETPPAAVWDALEPRLEDTRKRRPFGGWWPWIVMLLLVGSVAGFFVVRNSGKKNNTEQKPVNKTFVNNEIATIHTDSNQIETTTQAGAGATIKTDTQTYRTHYNANAVHLDKATPKQNKTLNSHTSKPTVDNTGLNETARANTGNKEEGTVTAQQKSARKTASQKNKSENIVSVKATNASNDASEKAGSNNTDNTANKTHTKSRKTPADNNSVNAANTTVVTSTAPDETQQRTSTTAKTQPSGTKATKKKTNAASSATVIADNTTTKKNVAAPATRKSSKKNTAKTTVAAPENNTPGNTALNTDNKETVADNTSQANNSAVVNTNSTGKKTSSKKKTNTVAKVPVAIDTNTDSVVSAVQTNNKKQTNKKTQAAAPYGNNNSPVLQVSGGATATKKKKTGTNTPTAASTATNTNSNNVVTPATTAKTTKHKATQQPGVQKTNPVAQNTDNTKQPTQGNTNGQKKINNTPPPVNPAKSQNTPSSSEEAKTPISVTPAPNDPKSARQTTVTEPANKPQQIVAGAENAAKAKTERDPRAGIPVSDYLNKSEENAAKTAAKTEADEDEQKVTASASGAGGGGAQSPLPAKKLHNPSQLEGGAKIGYESGFNNYTAHKWVGALYLQYNVSRKASFVVQPAIKLAQTNRSSSSTSDQSYYNVTGTNVSHAFSHTQFDSSSGRTDTFYNYTYKQNYDSIGVKKTVAKNYVEVEIPIIFKYEVAPSFSLMAGLTMNFGALPGTSETTTTYGSYVMQDTLSNIKNNTNYQINVNDSFAHNHTSAPYSSYTSSSGTTSNPIRFGYILGMNYILKERFLFDVTVQQSFSKQTNIQNTDVRGLFTQPYVRVMVGYRFFKPKKKALE